MSEPKKVYDIVTNKELSVDDILKLLSKHVSEKNWKLVAHYINLLVKSIGHLLV
jgi:hypothetical protein